MAKTCHKKPFLDGIDHQERGLWRPLSIKKLDYSIKTTLLSTIFARQQKIFYWRFSLVNRNNFKKNKKIYE